VIRPQIQKLLDEVGTAERPHGGRSLREHLEGTCRLLEQWGNPDEVCLAGLFHSIYGTQYYRGQSLPPEQRERVRRRIGLRAEELAYLFGACDREHLVSNVHKSGDYTLLDRIRQQEVPISGRTLSALLEIELANVLEQLPPSTELGEELRALWLRRWKKVRPFVSARAYNSFAAYFQGHEPEPAAP
jgi:hypothetical protein